MIEDVYIFGCPVRSSLKEWNLVSSVVSGKIVNGYHTNDWVLGVLYRAGSTAWIAGLNPIQVPGIENVKLDSVITGHLEYRLGLPRVLKHVGFETTNDHFEDEDELEEKLMQELRQVESRQDELKKKYKQQLAEQRRQDELVNEELRKQGIIRPWFSTPTELRPKELSSTLPPLVIPDAEFDGFVAKELESTLPKLVIKPESLAANIAIRQKGGIEIDSVLAQYDSMMEKHAGDTPGAQGAGDLADLEHDVEETEDSIASLSVEGLNLNEVFVESPLEIEEEDAHSSRSRTTTFEGVTSDFVENPW